MKCYTDCTYNQNHECARATVHLIQAICKDRTILGCDTKKLNKEKTSKQAATSIQHKALDFKGVVSD